MTKQFKPVIFELAHVCCQSGTRSGVVYFIIASLFKIIRSRPWRVKQSPRLFASAFLAPFLGFKHKNSLKNKAIFVLCCQSGTRTPIHGTRNRSPTIRRTGKELFLIFIRISSLDSILKVSDELARLCGAVALAFAPVALYCQNLNNFQVRS